MDNGCTQVGANEMIDDNYVESNRPLTKAQLIKTFQDIYSGFDDNAFGRCYGNNSKKWPNRPMILAIGYDNNIYIKIQTSHDLMSILDAPWQRDETLSSQQQKNKLSVITQLSDNTFIGVGERNGKIYTKENLTDDWKEEEVPAPVPFMNVRQLDGNEVLGIQAGKGKYHHMYRRNQDTSWTPLSINKRNSSCCVNDIIKDKGVYYGIGTNLAVYQRTSFAKGTRWVGVRNDLNRMRVRNIIKLPNVDPNVTIFVGLMRKPATLMMASTEDNTWHNKDILNNTLQMKYISLINSQHKIGEGGGTSGKVEKYITSDDVNYKCTEVKEK